MSLYETVADQLCECYDEYGKKLAQPCWRCEALAATYPMSRCWAMPNSETFLMKPAADFVTKYIPRIGVTVDPYARNSKLCNITNDLNSNTSALHHMDAIDFLMKLAGEGVKASGVVIDPPYSPTQIKECYQGIGIKTASDMALRGKMMKARRGLVNAITEPGSVVLSFGWNTNGMGKRGWRIVEILLISHGSDHNDTICMAEVKLAYTPDTGADVRGICPFCGSSHPGKCVLS